MPRPEITQEQSHVGLMAGFVELLLRQAPRSVLDVGCGSGGLMRACVERGLTVAGIDRSGERLDALAADGLDVHPGSAYELPFADGAFDWVTLRHVPHHLERPAEALAEAVRVAASGVIIAEPWFDEDSAPGRAGLALDVWEKRQHRRRGMYHAEVYPADALLAMLPTDAARAGAEAHVIPPVGTRSIPAFLDVARTLLARLSEDDDEAAGLDSLAVQFERDGLEWNGTVCLVVRPD